MSDRGAAEPTEEKAGVGEPRVVHLSFPRNDDLFLSLSRTLVAKQPSSFRIGAELLLMTLLCQQSDPTLVLLGCSVPFLPLWPVNQISHLLSREVASLPGLMAAAASFLAFPHWSAWSVPVAGCVSLSSQR